MVRGEDLRSGNSTSCGCLQKEKARARFLTHGQSETRLFKIWLQMKQRCFNPNDDKYADYGGRGITVKEPWLSDFEAFRRDMGPRPSDEHSVDRVNNDGNYEPGNCRWATRLEQAANRRVRKDSRHR